MRRAARNLGKILVSLGIIKEQELQDIIAQMKEIALSLFFYYEAAIGSRSRRSSTSSSSLGRIPPERGGWSGA